MKDNKVKIIHHEMKQNIDNKLYPGDVLIVSTPALNAVFKCSNCDWRLTSVSANDLSGNCAVIGTEGINPEDAKRINFWFGPQYKKIVENIYERFEKFLTVWRFSHPFRTKLVGYNRAQKSKLLAQLTVRCERT